jgi:cytochrome c
MYAWAERAIVTAAAVSVLAGAGAATAADERYGLGTPVSPAQIAGWDIDVRPDGHGLPPGQGTAAQGEALYAGLCVACHGEFGEGQGRFPALMGGRGTLASDNPVKTVGSFWPYATTLFDYLRRAQPFGHGQSLSANQLYALTAYLLNLNDLMALDEVLDAASLTAVAMPNRDGFVADDRPDVPAGERCMRECRGPVRVIGRAAQLGVTPEGDAPR